MAIEVQCDISECGSSLVPSYNQFVQTVLLRDGGGGHVQVTVISKSRSRNMSYKKGSVDEIVIGTIGAQVYKLSLRGDRVIPVVTNS